MPFGNNSKAFAFSVLTLGQNGVKYSTDAYKVALYGNSGTPDNTVTTAVLTEYNGTASQWVTANETSGTGYTAGGVSVTPTAWGQNFNSQGNNTVSFSSSGTPTWNSASFTTYGCLVYDTTVSNEGLAYLSFSGAQSVTAGTFTITWAANGIATFSC